MSGGPYIAAGMITMLIGVGALGLGFFRVEPSTIYLGAALVLIGYIMRELGLRVPY